MVDDHPPETTPRYERRYATHEEILAGIVHPDHIEINNQIYKELEEGTINLEESKRRHEELLIEVASIDHMTGLDNARSAHYKLARLMEYCQKGGIPLTVIYLDADGLKEVNDKLGHDIGDLVIKSLASAIDEGTRPTDLPVRLVSEEEASRQDTEEEGLEKQKARLGGDEFFSAFPGASLTETEVIFNRVQKIFTSKIALLPINFQEALGRDLSITGGAVQYDSSIDKSAEDFIKRADSAMRFGKEHNKGFLNISAAPTTSSL